ncbi:MAG: DNA translocase FtsK 4TM domain-containing protein, partial [Candidatus Nanopelagicales bacterium]|nr:DNA translocase FtsK 4TM domain-containing protein [Candidatus Nanopelagicales bacterium]
MARSVGRIVRLGGTAHEAGRSRFRDGLGLALWVSAVAVIFGAWLGWDGPVGWLVKTFVAGAIGAMSVLLPLFLLWFGWRVMRRPDHPLDGPVKVGWVLAALAGTGLWQCLAGAPSPSAGAESMRAAGGWLGWIVTAPLVAGVGSWVAGLAMIALLALGIILISGRPVSEVTAGIWQTVTRRDPDDQLLARQGGEAPDVEPESDFSTAGSGRPESAAGQPASPDTTASRPRLDWASWGVKLGLLRPEAPPRPPIQHVGDTPFDADTTVLVDGVAVPGAPAGDSVPGGELGAQGGIDGATSTSGPDGLAGAAAAAGTAGTAGTTK